MVIAFPVAGWVMSKWLQNYVYRISLSWWMFALAGCIALSIALITVSFQALKAAMANPVKSLKSE
jgi:ABC-type antimicrobial peptide transport system permease subunit